MQYVLAIDQRNSQRFGKEGRGPPFYKLFDSREANGGARKAFDLFRLSRGSSEHLPARGCPYDYMNKSGIFHHGIGEGSPQEISERWRRWQRKLCDYHRDRSNP